MVEEVWKEGGRGGVWMNVLGVGMTVQPAHTRMTKHLKHETDWGGWQALGCETRTCWNLAEHQFGWCCYWGEWWSGG